MTERNDETALLKAHIAELEAMLAAARADALEEAAICAENWEIDRNSRLEVYDAIRAMKGGASEPKKPPYAHFVFACETYYPAGGSDDLVGCFHSMAAAKAYALKQKDHYPDVHIMDAYGRSYDHTGTPIETLHTVVRS